MRVVSRQAEIPGELLVITGPAAAGKTTVARRIAEQSAEPSVHLQADDFFKALKTGRRRGWMSGAGPQHEVVFDAIGAAAGRYADGGYLVVVDTLLRPPYLDILVSAVPRRVAIHLVVLRPRFDVLLDRSHGRASADRHEDAVLRWLSDAFVDLGGLERFVIDNSDLQPDETIDVIRETVRSGRALFRLPSGTAGSAEPTTVGHDQPSLHLGNVSPDLHPLGKEADVGPRD